MNCTRLTSCQNKTNYLIICYGFISAVRYEQFSVSDTVGDEFPYLMSPNVRFNQHHQSHAVDSQLEINITQH